MVIFAITGRREKKIPYLRGIFIWRKSKQGKEMNSITIVRKQVESKKIPGKMFDVFSVRKEYVDKTTNEANCIELRLNTDEMKTLSAEIKKMEEDLAWQPVIKPEES
jgi:hypothetical protein